MPAPGSSVRRLGLSTASTATSGMEPSRQKTGLRTAVTHLSGPAAPGAAFGDDASLRTVGVTDRRLLDHEPPFRHAHHERRVVEVAGRTVREPGCYRLVDAAVQPHRVATCAEREPVEIDPGLKISAGSGHRPRAADSRSARSLIPASIRRSIRSEPGSIGNMLTRAAKRKAAGIGCG